MSTDRTLSWTQVGAGFRHQCTLYVHGLAVARLMGRSVILDMMHLNPFHNRTDSGELAEARTCSPKIFFDWARLNELVRVETVLERPEARPWFLRGGRRPGPVGRLADLMPIPGKARFTDGVTLGREYGAKHLHVRSVRLPGDFHRPGAIPARMLHPALQEVKSHLRCSEDIRERAASIRERLGDYDAMHVRRGDWVLQDCFSDETRSRFDPVRNSSLVRKAIPPGRKLYIATDERDPSFFGPLGEVYDLRFLSDFRDIVETDLPEGASRNTYYTLCIEEEVLVGAMRFMGTTYASTVRHVDLRRAGQADIDDGVYNLVPDLYAEYMRGKPLVQGLLHEAEVDEFLARIRW